MSGLSDADAESLARIIETTIGLGGIDHPDCRLCGRDIPCPTHTARAAVFNIRPTVEAIVTRAVNEALTEAATEIVSWERLLREAGNNGGPFMGSNRAAEDAYQRAARIVRARTH